MRSGLIACVVGLLMALWPTPATAADTPAAEHTRTKLLKVRVTINYKNTPLREVLKEVAAQVEMLAERPVMWTYAPDAPGGQPITYACEAKRVEEVLEDLGKLAGIGYIVVSRDDHKHDGWVRITKGPERGTGKYPPDDAPAIADPEEAKAAMRLKAAKTLLDMNQPADAKAVLMLVIEKHPKTKAAAEAKMLLEKLNK